MSTTFTPPPAPDGPVPSGPVPPRPPAPPGGAPVPPQPTRGGSRVVAILAIVLGGVILLGILFWAAVGAIASATVHDSTRAVAVDGVSELDVSLSAGFIRIEYADIDEAELSVRGSWGADRWTFERDGDGLVVASPQSIFGLGWLLGGNGDAVLRLPAALEGIDGDLRLSAGELRAEGAFGELDLELNAGELRVDGSARSLDLDVNAGSADVAVDGVREAVLSVSAGSLNAELRGSPPRSVSVDVSAGSADITVPDGSYAVTSNVSAGGFDNRIGSDPNASNRIDVDVSAGSVTLRSTGR